LTPAAFAAGVKDPISGYGRLLERY